MYVLRTDTEDNFLANIVRDFGICLLRRDLDLRAAEGERVVGAVLHERSVDKVHLRGAHEACDELVDREVIQFCGVSTCWMKPSFITTILSPMVIASVWSWVT